MTKLTDEELGDLLRETFADRETLVRQLPEATKRRHPGPILLAAAAVLAVLAGVLYGVHRADRPDPAPPVAAATEPGDIWGAAIVAIARQFAPAGGWQSIEVSGPGDRPWTLPSGATPPPRREVHCGGPEADRAGGRAGRTGGLERARLRKCLRR
ncbi:hypothetical protein [Kribbella jiaozuonensis]|uniref:Uncharacterized protein n=1 Tax=Kribbella jiaozuonensis TaxID=2575441 RepID=A0A4U3M0H0_9ACTN|nr:hypothetical protein [Kribbella jiaozuonensis]TKK81409.1 hypothetical protein FDA38_00650 [Kribbella jiaozuonensis]